MNKIFITILLLSAYFKCFAQDISGNWVKYKFEMKDGSKVLPYPYADSTYLEVKFEKNKICFNTIPTLKNDRSCFEFKRESKNFIKTSDISGYEIESFKNDTMVIREVFSDNHMGEKRYFLIREEALYSNQLIKNKLKKEITTTKFFTPKLSSSLEKKINNRFSNYTRDLNFHMRGELIITTKSESVKVNIEFNDLEKKRYNNLIKRILENSYEDWNLSYFQNFETIKIPFLIKGNFTDMFRGVSIMYHSKDFNDFYRDKGIGILEIIFSNDLYELGYQLHDEGQNELAIISFLYSYDLNPKKVQALFNVASIYQEMGDKQMACEMWLRILEIGQNKAGHFLEKYCK